VGEQHQCLHARGMRAQSRCSVSRQELAVVVNSRSAPPAR
jgi:hypothetical protein